MLNKLGVLVEKLVCRVRKAKLCRIWIFIKKIDVIFKKTRQFYREYWRASKL